MHRSKTMKKENPVENSSLGERRLTEQNFVDELKQDCMYKRMIITDYVALDEANNSTRLQVSKYEKPQLGRNPCEVHLMVCVLSRLPHTDCVCKLTLINASITVLLHVYYVLRLSIHMYCKLFPSHKLDCVEI